MKRIACLLALMALSSPASARGYSFTFHGHRVHVAAHCRSLSCISVSGIAGRRHRDNDTDAANEMVPAPAEVPAQVPAAPPSPVPVQPLAVPARPPVVTAQAQAAAVITRAATQAATSNRPAEVTSSTPPAPPPAVPVAQETASAAVETPLGDWQTDGKDKSLVRIEACGTALCGYTLDAATGAEGETVLVNMKPKSDTKWTGNVYSRSSGNSYYGTMTLKRERDTLLVEACALGHFFCSGNNWTRVVGNSDEVVTSQHAAREPRS